MPDLKEILITKATGLNKKPEETLEGVKKAAEDMTVIDQAMGTAQKLAGTNALKEQLERKEGQVEKLGDEKDKIKDELHETRIQLIQKELGGKIDSLAESIKSGASPKSISDQISEVKKAADSLGIGASKVSEFKEMANLIQSLNPQQKEKGLAEQVKEAKELLDTLQPKEEKKAPVTEIPASIILEIKKMDINLQLEIEQRKDERQRRDQDFKLTTMKWEEERDITRQEVEGKIAVERERNDLLAGGLDRLGRIITQATSETEAPSQSRKVAAVQAGEGEFGEVICANPKCQATVAVARDAVKVTCPGCGTSYPVNRIKREIPVEQDKGAEQAEPGSEQDEGVLT